jgi:hypothetical protein
MISLMAFLRLSRPHFLMGGALMYAVGVAQGKAIGIATYLLGQAMVSNNLNLVADSRVTAGPSRHDVDF